MSYPAGYLRKSRSDDPTREVSRDVQEQAIREMAAKDGHADVRLFVDWDRSGDAAKVEQRAAYQALLGALRTREVSTVYAYSADRLYRGIGTFHDLMTAAEAANVRIVTSRDGVIGGDGSPMATAFSQIGAVFAELELNTAKARAKGAAAVRRRRGDHLGAVPYGYRLDRGADGVVRLIPRPEQPIGPVLDAWERSGRRPRACVRILNDEMRIPAQRGGPWDRSSILRLIAREAPDRLPRRAPSGRREESASLTRLAKLLRCHCGRTLTPNIHREQRDGRGASVSVNYYCARGHAARADHPRVYVSESVLMPWVVEEAARLAVPFAQALTMEQHVDERSVLDAKRARAVESYIEGLIDKEDRDRRLAVFDRELDRLDTRARAVDVPPTIDWTWAPETINDVLRGLFEYIQLDPQLRPVDAAWTVPEWRAP